jgi:hypothetical protein
MDRAVRRGIVAAVSLWLFAIAIGGVAAARPVVTDIGIQPKTFMFVGNSFMYYNNSMHDYLLEMARAGDNYAPGYRATSITMSGSGISWHDLESYFKPGA